MVNISELWSEKTYKLHRLKHSRLSHKKSANFKEKKERKRRQADLSPAVCSLLNAETNKDRVCHFDQDVIDTVHMDELNPPPLHVIQNTLVPQCSVKTPIPICKTNTDTHLYLQHKRNPPPHTHKMLKLLGGLTRGHGDLSFSLQDDLASVVHGWQHSLLKEDDFLLVQTKIVVFWEEVLGGLHCPAASHDVPEGSTQEAQSFTICTPSVLFSVAFGKFLKRRLDSCWFQIKRHFILTRECNTWFSASAQPASAASICAQPGSERGFCGMAARHRTCLWDKWPLVWFLGPQPVAGLQLYSQRCTADLKHQRAVWAIILTENKPQKVYSINTCNIRAY